jgi:Fe-S-cluster-containing hydrogenase component 2
MADKSKDNESSDIFSLLLETSKKEKERKRAELLKPLGIKEFFVGGSIKIDFKTCRGVECKLCIDVCPTHALYWQLGKVEITEELCIYCGACVLACIVDDCIFITRKRPTGETERFSKPGEIPKLFNSINGRKRKERVWAIFPSAKSYLERYLPHFC